MSKMHYFSNKFSKIAKRWEQSLWTFNIDDLEVPWFSQIVVFQADYD